MGTRASPDVVLLSYQPVLPLESLVCVLDQRRFALLTLQERHESLRESNKGEVVGLELHIDGIKIDSLRVGKVPSALHAGVQNDAIEVCVGLCNAVSESMTPCSFFGGQTNFVTKVGIFSSSVMSKGTALDLSLPCLCTMASRFSFRLPTTMTLLPSVTRREAMASPIPLVAPITRTFLYGKGMIASLECHRAVGGYSKTQVDLCILLRITVWGTRGQELFPRNPYVGITLCLVMLLR